MMGLIFSMVPIPNFFFTMRNIKFHASSVTTSHARYMFLL